MNALACLLFGISILLPVLLSALLHRLFGSARAAALPGPARQAVVGLLFGLLSALANQWYLPVGATALNVRDAMPLCAGLIFGSPAGLIAGFLGGAFRWFSVAWGGSSYSRLASSLSCLLAGVLAAAARRFLFEDKRPLWVYGPLLAVVVKVFNILLVLFVRPGQAASAFAFVSANPWVLFPTETIPAMLALFVVSRFDADFLRCPPEKRPVTQTFQLLLLIYMTLSCCVTVYLTYYLQSRIASANTDQTLTLELRDAENDLEDTCDEGIVPLVEVLAQLVLEEPSRDTATLRKVADGWMTTELCIFDAEGRIIASTIPARVGQSFPDGAAIARRVAQEETVALPYDRAAKAKSVGTSLPDGQVLMATFGDEITQTSVDSRVGLIANNWVVGQDGFIVLYDSDGILLSDSHGNRGEPLSAFGLDPQLYTPDTVFRATLFGVDCYCVFRPLEAIPGGYSILAAQPVNEVLVPRNIAVYTAVLMDILVFAVLFVTVYFLVKRLVVDNIRRTNRSLAKIIDGDLDEVVAVQSSAEFSTLSDDINATVGTLKRYIAEEAARIDQELEFARRIQRSALPSVFPPFPHRTEFEIYARMDPAKEVGGDFYDFYLLGEDTLIFLIADVSGKGIPAALFMMQAKTMIKSLAESGRSVEEVFRQTNAHLCEQNEAEMFVTAWMGRLELSTGILRYVNAGHNPPLLRHGEGQFSYLRGRSGLMLAAMEDTRYSAHTVQLYPGDTLFLYTDGVTEATDRENRLLGEERLAHAVNTEQSDHPAAVCTAVTRCVKDFVGDAPQFDDITMLCVALHNLQTEDSITTRVNLESAAAVAGFVGTKLADWKTPRKNCATMQIVVDELYSNLIRYSGATGATLTLTQQDGALQLRVRDDGIPFDATACPVEGENQGLATVRKLAAALDYHRIGEENELCVTLPPPEPQP